MPEKEIMSATNVNNRNTHSAPYVARRRWVTAFFLVSSSSASFAYGQHPFDEQHKAQMSLPSGRHREHVKQHRDSHPKFMNRQEINPSTANAIGAPKNAIMTFRLGVSSVPKSAFWVMPAANATFGLGL